MFGFKRRRNFRKRSALDYIAIPELPHFDLDPETKRGIWVVLFIAVGAISTLGLFDMAGNLGQYLNQGLTWGFGWGKWLMPLLLIVLGYVIYNEELEVKKSNYFGLFIFILSLQSLFMLLINSSQWQTAISEGSGGGRLGLFLASNLVAGTGLGGSAIIVLGLLIISILLMFNTGLARLFGRESILGKMMTPIVFIMSALAQWRQRRQLKAEEESSDETAEDESSSAEATEDEEDEEEDESEDEEDNGEEEGNEEEEGEDDEDEKKEQPKLPAFKTEEIKNSDNDFWWQPTGIKIDLPLNLLDGRREKPTSGDIKENQEIIKKTLENFGILVEMGEISVGPTVTQYTFKPAEGVKLSRITTLSNDLALALAAHPIRIEAPIPGKRLVGVEVPNQAKAVVSLREVLSSRSYEKRKTDMMVALGKNVAGEVLLDDLSKMPHILVAGATNSGKSVCLNAIIVSLMYQNNPDELRFIMVDPKRVEMQIYNGMPYLLTPVMTDVSKTINALKWCLLEMEKRFDILSHSGYRNIQAYNESQKIKMPYIVFVIDELADLMSANARDIEAGVIRLAQMARAVGIHLVLATQRPSVDIITGLIKANMPARIAFSVASGTDSRTIIDTLGAEKLLGRGDMLFINAEMSKPVRLQGAFLSDSEIRRVVRYTIDKAGGANYLENVTDKQKMSGSSFAGSGDDDYDEFLDEARDIILNQGKASASYLQRRLSIGYNRAARILDILEKMGVVGPSNGSKAREILVSKSEYDATVETAVSGVTLHSREEAEAPDNFLNSLGEEADLPPVLTKKKIEDDIDWDGAEKTDKKEDEEQLDDVDASTEEDVEEDDNQTADEQEKEPEIKFEKKPARHASQGDAGGMIKEKKKIEVTKNDDDPSYEITKDDEDEGKYFSR